MSASASPTKETHEEEEEEINPGYDIDETGYYYEDEPRGGPRRAPRKNAFGLENRKLTDREKMIKNKLWNLRGKSLPDGTRNGQLHKRQLDYGPGGEELLQIVAGLGRGVKKLNGTQTLDGANAWIKKYRKDQDWSAFEEDITGPKGKPDGKKEVIVCDAKGNVRIVNGYTLCGSDYDWRKAYYTDLPTKKEQKKTRFSEYRTLKGMISPDLDKNGRLQYAYNVNFVKRRKISAKQAYKQRFFTPVYKEFAEELTVLKYDAMSKARLCTNVFNYVYGILFERPAIIEAFADITNESFDTMNEEDYKEYAKDSEVKRAIEEALLKILQDKDKTTKLYISTAHLVTYALVKDSRIDIKENKLVLGIPVSDLVDFKKMQTEINKTAVITTVAKEVEKRTNSSKEARKKLRKTRESEYNKYLNKLAAGQKAWSINPLSIENEYYSRTVDSWNLYNGIKSAKTTARQTAATSAYESRATSKAATRQASDDEDDGKRLELDDMMDAIYKANPDLDAAAFNESVDKLIERYVTEKLAPERYTKANAKSEILANAIKTMIAQTIDDNVKTIIPQVEALKALTPEQQNDLRRRMSASINSIDYDITNPEEMLTIMRFIYENSEVLTETYLKTGDPKIGDEYVKWSTQKSSKKSPKK